MTEVVQEMDAHLRATPTKMEAARSRCDRDSCQARRRRSATVVAAVLAFAVSAQRAL